jgi:flagellar basal-body rod protein FlgB
MAPIIPLASEVVRVVSLALDAASLRQQAIAANIANAGDPAYQRRGVSFEARLRVAAAGSALANVSSAALQPRLVNDNSAAALDQDMAAMAGNTLHFQALLKALNAELELMGLAANDGRR